MITNEQALAADVFHYSIPGSKNCARWRRNGKTKMWKRNPDRWEVPVKWGLYSFSKITNLDADSPYLHVESECPYHV